MRVSEHFAGSYLKADDLDKQGKVYRIEFVEVEKVGSDEKWVAHFKGEEKTLPLNKTNVMEIAEAYGDESDDWTGHYVRVYRDTTMFAGKKVSCIRVEASKSIEASAQSSGRNSGSPTDGEKLPF